MDPVTVIFSLKYFVSSGTRSVASHKQQHQHQQLEQHTKHQMVNQYPENRSLKHVDYGQRHTHYLQTLHQRSSTLERLSPTSHFHSSTVETAMTPFNNVVVYILGIFQVPVLKSNSQLTIAACSTNEAELMGGTANATKRAIWLHSLLSDSQHNFQQSVSAVSKNPQGVLEKPTFILYFSLRCTIPQQKASVISGNPQGAFAIDRTNLIIITTYVMLQPATLHIARKSADSF